MRLVSFHILSGLLALMLGVLPSSAKAAPDPCEVFTASELSALHVPNAHIVTKTDPVSGAAFGTSGTLRQLACTFIGSPPDSGLPPEANVFMVMLSVTWLPSEAAAKMRNDLEGKPENPPPDGAQYEVEQGIACADLPYPPMTICEGIRGNLRLTLLVPKLHADSSASHMVREHLLRASDRVQSAS
jgi:hypothetical protein